MHTQSIKDLSPWKAKSFQHKQTMLKGGRKPWKDPNSHKPQSKQNSREKPQGTKLYAHSDTTLLEHNLIQNTTHNQASLQSQHVHNRTRDSTADTVKSSASLASNKKL